MLLWRLASPEQFSEPALAAHHSHWLCLASVCLAILAAWVLLPLTDRYHRARGRARLYWLFAGGSSMGIGIWAMHFTAMLAFTLPVPIRYDPTITLISIIPATLATCFCIHLFIPHRHTIKRLVLMAGIMAAGIGSMHYIGMEAILVPANMYYVPEYFLLSIIAAFLLALCGLYAYKSLAGGQSVPSLLSKAVGSVLLGIAVSGMHFIAMEATYFQPQAHSVPDAFSILPFDLVIGIIAVTIVLIGMVIISVLVDRQMEVMAKSLAVSELRFKTFAETTHTAIFTFKNDHILYFNPAFARITGRDERTFDKISLTELIGFDFEELTHELQREDSQHQAIYKELEIETDNGEKRWLYFSLTMMDIHTDPIGLASAFDITEQKSAELDLRKIAYSDQLTSISNRMMFMDRLQHHLNLLSRRSSVTNSCLMLLDLDGFKSINDMHGHLAGDQILISVAERLQKIARKSDTVARLGGDEFVLLLEDINIGSGISIVADRIANLLAKPHPINDLHLALSASIGIVELSDHYVKPDQALHDADIALYRAKNSTSDRWVLFNEALDASVKRKRLLQSELVQALKDQALELYYQPIVSAVDHSVQGFEALARWQRATGEWVPPDEFIPIAENAGLVADIGLWALETACSQLNSWLSESIDTELYVSINIAPISLEGNEFIHRVSDMFERYDFSAGQLKIEITETMLVGDIQKVQDKLNALIKLGCDVMIDDFGTGYSSLSYLHRLPIKTVKIDRSFVADLDQPESSITIVKSIIALADSLNMSVVSEGVETQDQAQRLALLGSEQLQGYLFSRPLPQEQTFELLNTVKSKATSSR